MQGIGYITGQRISYEKDRFWLVRRAIPYRIIGAIFKRSYKRKFSSFQGIYLNTRVAKSGSVNSIVYEVFLKSNTGPLKVYTASKEDAARIELECIALLTALPETKLPPDEFTVRKAIIVVIIVLLLPILMLGLFLIVRSVR
jgi:hypothetical protein